MVYCDQNTVLYTVKKCFTDAIVSTDIVAHASVTLCCIFSNPVGTIVQYLLDSRICLSTQPRERRIKGSIRGLCYTSIQPKKLL